MHCSRCRKETEGPLFCEYCGAALKPLLPPAPTHPPKPTPPPAPAQPPPSAPPPVSTQPPKPRPDIPRWVWIVGGAGMAAVLLMIGLAVVIVMVTRPSAARTPVPVPTQIPSTPLPPTRAPAAPQGTTPTAAAYYVDPNLVTNKQYIDFLYEMNPEQMNKQWGPDLYMGPEDEPAGWVAWGGADSYCSHLGGYLPTETHLLEAGPARNAAFGFEWTSTCYGDTCKHLNVFQNGNWGTEYRDASPENIFFRCVLPVYEENQ